MAKYRCDLCNHRKKTKFGDYCMMLNDGRKNRLIPKDAIEPPDFCYVWKHYDKTEEWIEWIAEKK